MNKSALRLHALCCIGPHLIAAFISLCCDIKSWYDTIPQWVLIILTIFLIISHELYLPRHYPYQEVSRQARSTDWNRLANPEILGYYLFTAHATKGIGTFIKLLPTASVVIGEIMLVGACPLFPVAIFYKSPTFIETTREWSHGIEHSAKKNISVGPELASECFKQVLELPCWIGYSQFVLITSIATCLWFLL
uniref:Uncharacterized protein n=1 Tax=Daphnia galeata TaxID=27404 RepID=A0A8J2WP88_9CRUS|nr:unnamed protein product [Daphnia galeata]